MESPFGEWYIDIEVFIWIFLRLPNGSTILELGSGRGTGSLARLYKMYSIENEEQFLNKQNTTYIHAPYKEYKPDTLWYDIQAIKDGVPKNYDLLLIDGPSSSVRPNMLDHLELFDLTKPIVIDDLQENDLMKFAEKLAAIVNRKLEVMEGKSGKKFGVIDVR